MDIESGQRIGGFLILVDIEGRRHAVRLSSIQCLSDADVCRDETAIILTGNRRLILHHALDEVLKWF